MHLAVTPTDDATRVADGSDSSGDAEQKSPKAQDAVMHRIFRKNF